MTSARDQACELLALCVLENGERWGDAASPVQVSDALAVLDPVASASRHWLGRPRGFSKTTDVAALTLAIMLTQLPAGARCYAAAADRDQARLLVDALAGFVLRTPELAGAVVLDQYKVTTRNNVVLEVIAADAASAYGLRPYWLVMDELCQWPETRNARKVYEALSTALPKVPASRSVVITTAGSPGHWSRRVYESALAESQFWRVSDTHEAPPWVDPAEIEAERRRLPESAFARLWRNEWAASEDSAFRPEDVEACATLTGPLSPHAEAHAAGGYVVTCDLGWRNDRTVIAVAHAEANQQRLIVDRLHVLQGSRRSEVDLPSVERMIEVLAREFAAPVVFDPAQAVAIRQSLSARGIMCREHVFSATSNTQLALLMLELVRSHRLVMPNDDDLISEFLNVRIVERGPGLYRVDHDPDKHDDQVVAIGMAATELIRTAVGGLESYLGALAEEQTVEARRRFREQLFDPETGQPRMTEEAALRMGFTPGIDGKWR